MAGSDAEPKAESRFAYREESGRLVLANPVLSFALSASDGTILSFLHRETRTDLIDAQEAALQGFLWRIELAGEGLASQPAGRDDAIAITNRDCAEFVHALRRHRHEEALRLWLHWRGFRAGGAEIGGALTVQVTLPGDAASVSFEHEIELPEGYSLRSLSLPCLCAVGCPDPLADDGLFFPLSGGVLLPNPRAMSPAGEERTWEMGYPGPASLQLFGYCCGDRLTLWLAAQDGSGARKSLAASRGPSSSRLRLWMTHYPTLRPDGRWSAPYPTTTGFAAGDWFEAARDYRAWAVQQPWTARGRGGERTLPPLTTAYGLWASHWGSARRAVAAARELQRLVNLPIKLDWRCWHACARGGAYPDYLPPRDGEEAVATAERQLADAGVLHQLDVNALLASRESSVWATDDAEAHVLSDSEDASRLTGRVRYPLAVMCPGTAYWRQTVAGLGRQLAQRGADGVRLEEVGSAEARSCANERHEHGSPHPSQWSASVRSLLTAVRKEIGPGRQVAAEGLSEAYLDLVDAFVVDHAAAERSIALPAEFGDRWVPIPLFASVYHDYAVIVGPAVSLVNQRPHDPMWPASTIGELREPPHVMQRDYHLQFCLEVARAMIWGYQPLLENFWPEQARDDSARHKLAFLAAALRAQAWGVGALLPQSQFLGPLATDCPALEAELLVNPPGCTASERRSVRRSLASVHGSAWRIPGGGLVLVLVNISTQSVDFTARLRSSRLNLQLPLRLIGRIFSEDGDVPAVSLRASGSEIGGRLPGRAIVLISLR